MDSRRDAGRDAAFDVGDAGGDAAVAGEPRSLVIALDGVRPDALARARTPNLDALIAGTWQAGYRGAYTPLAQNLYGAATVSGPNHVAIMTGANAAQSGVTGNGDVGGGNFIDFPHYLRLLENEDPSRNTACLFTWPVDAVVPSRADLVENDSDAANVARAAAILEGTHAAAGWPAGTDPHAVFLFLDDGDGAGHGHGFEPGVPEYLTELEQIDGQLGSLFDAIAARPTFGRERWQIVLTSDHGGYGTGHGGSSAAEHTIPFLVVSQAVAQGRLPNGTSIVDVVPTVLDHMGVAVPPALTGRTVGRTVVSEPPDLGVDLARYYRFEGDLADALGAFDATVAGGTPTVLPSGGLFGGYLAIDRADGDYVSLGDLDFADGDSFTVALWLRPHGPQTGDPVVIGNKDWVSGANPGWLLGANEGGGDSFGTNYASSGADRIDAEDIDYSGTGWHFVAAVFHDASLAVLYAGPRGGALRWIAVRSAEVGDLSSPLPTHVGQDGTGSYPSHLDADIDDLAIWRRGLGFEEILRLYADGAGIEVETAR